MKESELRELSTCGICNQPVAGKLPIFITATIEQHAIDIAAVERQQGLAMILGGNGALAIHMGPNEDMTKTIMSKTKISVCHNCAMESPIVLAAITKTEESEQ